MVPTYNMNGEATISVYSTTETYPDAVVYLTDPGTLTHSSIDLSSQTGDTIKCEQGNLCTFEIGIKITDLRNPAGEDTCSDDIPYANCVEEQTMKIYLEVKNKTLQCLLNVGGQIQFVYRIFSIKIRVPI